MGMSGGSRVNAHYASMFFETPPEALLALVVAFSELLAPIALINFFISEFLFS